MRVQGKGARQGTKVMAHSDHHLMLVVGVLSLHIVPHEEPECVEWECVKWDEEQGYMKGG